MRESETDARATALLAAIAEAGHEVGAFRAAPERLAVGLKGHQDFITAADGAVERLLRERLIGAFPADAFLGEETGGSSGERKRDQGLWVVDPIDGTANFARGLPHFCISVALVEGSGMLLGAILDPVLDELYFARSGRGATRNGHAITASPTANLAEAAIEIGWSTRVSDARYLECVARTLATGAAVRRGGSGALGLAYVADGRQDAYAELHINSWDCLAGLLIVREAGGRISPFLANGGLEHGAPILASAPGIATAMSDLTGIPLAPI
ncbi:MAG: inositol monophosphatase family protein [Acetobacteraceae bacterium]